MIRRKIKIFFKFAFERRALWQNVWIGLFVGTILNLINQGPALIHLNPSHLHLGKLILTYCVPYLVSTYSGSLAKMKYVAGGVAEYSAIVRCKSCRKHEIRVQKGDILPDCPICGPGADWQILDLQED